MSIILNGTTGITTPADTVTGNATVGGTLNVTGATVLGAATLGATTATSLSVGGTAVVAVAPSTSGNVLFTTDGSTWSSTQKITQSTAVTLTTQTSVDFTSIPSWVKRVTVMFNGVSTNGTSPIQLQIGSGSIDAASYVTVSSVIGASSAAGGSALTTAWLLVTGSSYMSAAYALNGAVTFVLIGSNTWIITGITSSAASPHQFFLSGTKTLSGALDRLRISTTGGTDTFDAGSINILYE